MTKFHTFSFASPKKEYHTHMYTNVTGASHEKLDFEKFTIMRFTHYKEISKGTHTPVN